jgi:hypothetical protein
MFIVVLNDRGGNICAMKKTKSTGIPLQSFLKILDEIEDRELMNDNEIAEAIDLGGSTITVWRAGGVKNVSFIVLRKLRDKFGYQFTRGGNGDWLISKVAPHADNSHPVIKEPIARYDDREVIELKKRVEALENKCTQLTQENDTLRHALAHEIVEIILEAMGRKAES